MMNFSSLARPFSRTVDSSRRFAPLLLGVQVLIASFLGGCRCPEAPRTPAAIQDDQLAVNATASILKTARTNKVWTDADQQAFNESVSRLSFKSRFQFSKQLTGLITSQAVVLAHTTESDEPPPQCTCVPSPCVPGGTPGTKN